MFWNKKPLPVKTSDTLPIIEWAPLRDITPYELAQLMPMAGWRGNGTPSPGPAEREWWDNLPPGTKRHWRLISDTNNGQDGVTTEQLDEADEANAGYCIACGAWRDCCEPDACNYECSECSELQVFGAMELILMGYVSGPPEK